MIIRKNIEKFNNYKIKINKFNYNIIIYFCQRTENRKIYRIK